MDFEEANKVVHPVEGEWHYQLMTAYGYVPETKEAIGFVRTYLYKHSVTGAIITCHTGASADYFKSGDRIGYAHSLATYLEEKSA